MRLFELAGPDPKVIQLIAIANQLKDAIDSGKEDPSWTVDELLQYFQKYGINLSNKDLYNMIKQPPLNNVISNIQGDQVVFKGQDNSDGVSDDETENQKVVAQMAQSAMPSVP